MNVTQASLYCVEPVARPYFSSCHLEHERAHEIVAIDDPARGRAREAA